MQLSLNRQTKVKMEMLTDKPPLQIAAFSFEHILRCETAGNMRLDGNELKVCSLENDEEESKQVGA